MMKNKTDEAVITDKRKNGKKQKWQKQKTSKAKATKVKAAKEKEAKEARKVFENFLRSVYLPKEKVGLLQKDSFKAVYKYSDRFFYGQSFEFSYDLARISLCLAVAAMNPDSLRGDYENAPENLKRFLENLGFSDFYTNEDYKSKPRTDSFGVGIAKKKIRVGGKTYTLLAVGCRGGGYELEWCGNFDIGSDGDFAGFKATSQIAFDFINKYIYYYHVSGPVILWSAGFSRGGATCNMLGGKIDTLLSSGQQPFDGVTLEKRHAYFYTFEAPRGACSESRSAVVCTNIFNIINENDLVTYAAPSAMGFGRFGKDVFLPSRANCEKRDYEKILKKVKDEINIIYSMNIMALTQNILGDVFITPPKFIRKETRSVGDFLSDYMQIVCDEANGREESLPVFSAIQHMLSIFFKVDSEMASVIFKEYTKRIAKNTDSFLSSIFDNNNDARLNVMRENFYIALKDSGVTEKTVEEIREDINTVFGFFSKVADDYPYEFSVLTLNLPAVVSPHDYGLELAFLNALDEDYFKNV